MSTIVTAEYVSGIADARALWRALSEDERTADAAAYLAGTEATMRRFSAGPVKEHLRGERDFWRAQVRRTARAEKASAA